jgi:hypothetical protein
MALLCYNRLENRRSLKGWAALLAIEELELTPHDLSPNWYALMFCIMTRHDPEKVLDKALAKFELKDKPRPGATQPEDPAAAILSIIERHRKPF